MTIQKIPIKNFLFLYLKQFLDQFLFIQKIFLNKAAHRWILLLTAKIDELYKGGFFILLFLINFIKNKITPNQPDR